MSAERNSPINGIGRVTGATEELLRTDRIVDFVEFADMPVWSRCVGPPPMPSPANLVAMNPWYGGQVE